MSRPRHALARWREGLRTYRRQIAEPRADVPIAGRLGLVRDFPAWYRTQGRSPLEAGRPWITFEATRILEAQLAATSRVFEYGSGGSTIFFARRVSEVVSVEHDPRWFEEVSEAVASLPRATILLAPPRRPTDAAEAGFASTSPEFAGLTFIDYVTAVDRFDAHHFDVLVVDGRARPSAFLRAEPMVRVGGLVVLDDSERPAYAAVMDAAAAAGWVERGRLGPKPFSPAFARTTVWSKTRDLAGGAATDSRGL